MALKGYHVKQIAATQVDMIGYSMGGLIIRGFAQQSDFLNQSNFMKGYIHRLITIGTPHFGAHLAGILYENKDKYFCFQMQNFSYAPPDKCSNPQSLKSIYSDILNRPIEAGGVTALIPNCTAYAHLCQTNITSYSMTGNWRPHGIISHNNTETRFKEITNNSNLSLEGIFHGDKQSSGWSYGNAEGEYPFPRRS